MVCDAPGTFNVSPEDYNTDRGNPRPQECVDKDQNNDILITPSTNVGDRGELGIESCLVGIRNVRNNIHHQTLISYCKSSHVGLLQADLRHKLVITF